MAYGYKRQITQDHTKLGSSDLTDFPVLLLPQSGDSFADSLRIVGSGGKIDHSCSFNGQTVPAPVKCFSDDGVTATPHDYAFWNSATGASEIWVKRSLSHTADTSFWVYYGDSGVTTYQGGAVGDAYPSSAKGVWHFADGSTLSGKDSSANGNDALGLSTTAATAGQIDGGAAFDGANAHVDTPSQDASGGFTVKARVNNTDASSKTTIVGQGSDTASTISPYFRIGSGATSGFTSPALTYHEVGTAFMTTGSWHGLALSYDLSTLRFYVDGSLNNSSADAATPDNATGHDFMIGLLGDTLAQVFKGSLDEVQFWNVALSADWLLADDHNQSSPATFTSIGSETAVSGSTTYNATLSASQSQTAALLRAIASALKPSQSQTAVLVRGVSSALKPGQAQTATALRSVGSARTATQSSIATVIRSVGSHVAAGVGQAASLLRSIGTILGPTQASAATVRRSVGSTETASQGSTATTTRQIGAVRSPTQATTVSLGRAIGSHVTSAVGQAVTTIAGIASHLSSSQTVTATMTAGRAFVSALTTTAVSTAATLGRVIGVNKSAGAWQAATLRRSIGSTLRISVSAIATARRAITHALVAVVLGVPSVIGRTAVIGRKLAIVMAAVAVHGLVAARLVSRDRVPAALRIFDRVPAEDND